MPGELPEDQLKQLVIEQLIESRLWMQVAKEMGVVVTADTMSVPSTIRHLYRHLRENRRIEPLERYDRANLAIQTRDVHARLARGDSTWEASVPAGVRPRRRPVPCPRTRAAVGSRRDELPASTPR